MEKGLGDNLYVRMYVDQPKSKMIMFYATLDDYRTKQIYFRRLVLDFQGYNNYCHISELFYVRDTSIKAYKHQERKYCKGKVPIKQNQFCQV